MMTSGEAIERLERIVSVIRQLDCEIRDVTLEYLSLGGRPVVMLAFDAWSEAMIGRTVQIARKGLGNYDCYQAEIRGVIVYAIVEAKSVTGPEIETVEWTEKTAKANQ